MYAVDQIEPLIAKLFDAALAIDEFEYCCTLLRIRGIEPIAWDPLLESQALVQDTMGLIQAPIDGAMRMRLLLFLYCHITEMNDVFGWAKVRNRSTRRKR